MKGEIKASELRAKSRIELNKELSDLLKAQFGLRMQLASQQLSDVSALKKIRRLIARVRTILSEQISEKTLTRETA